MSADPLTLAAAAGLPPDKVQARFLEYQSLDERFAGERKFVSEKQRLEQQIVLFPVNSSALVPDQSIRLDNIEESVDRLLEYANKVGRKIHITVYGRADQTGAETKNTALSTQRAENVHQALVDRGIPADLVSAVGLGNSQPIRHGSAGYQLEVNRSVVLKVESQHQGDKQ
jgi:outer membrane protein OmpA-like peptidoglycan-associated protein